MKKIFNLILCGILVLTIIGCSTNKEIEEENKISYLNCVYKDDDWLSKVMLEYNEFNELNKFDFEVRVDWGNKYGGGTDQVYELAEKYVKEDLDSEFDGIDYIYEFYKDGTAIAKFSVDRNQIENNEITMIDGTNISDMFKMSKSEMNVYFKQEKYYCTTNSEENWDIIIFDPLYEYTDIYLDYINENVTYSSNVMYSWYILTTDKKVMNVVYMLDYEDGFTYAYYDYKALTLEEALQNAKYNKMDNIYNKDKYVKWLESKKKEMEETNKKTIKEEVIYEVIDHEIIEVPDNNKYEGYMEVIQQGQNGVKEVTYEVTYDYQGIEISRKKMKEDIHKEPIIEIIKVGTK